MSDDSGINYQTSLPLAWQNVPAPDTAMLAQARDGNILLLQALATLESAAEKDHVADPALSKAVVRLEAKLDIALTLLGKLLAEQLASPASVPVTLGVNQIAWRDAAPLPALDASILVNLRLSPRLPEFLQLYARVVAVEDGACSAEFLDRDSEQEEWITRTLFRYHRRALQARHQL